MSDENRTSGDRTSARDDGPAGDAQLPDDREPYETRVPADDSPVRCPYCERPLESETLLVLHKGLDHWTHLSDEEQEAFREAYADESDDIRTFRLKMLGLLVLLYFGFLFVYSYFTTDPLSAAALLVGSISARECCKSQIR